MGSGERDGQPRQALQRNILMPPAELIQAIGQVHAGGALMSRQVARKVMNHFQQIKEPQSDMEQLTKRESEILALLAKGFLYKEIADQLGISLSTAHKHLHVFSMNLPALKI